MKSIFDFCKRIIGRTGIWQPLFGDESHTVALLEKPALLAAYAPVDLS